MRVLGRSSEELAYRLRQLVDNAKLWAAHPKAPRNVGFGDLPFPRAEAVREQLRDSAFHAQVRNLADQICGGRIPLFGNTIATGDAIDWRRDYINNKQSGLEYFRFVPYLDFQKVGDHKNIWELSRHQHLVLLAQAFVLEPDPRYLAKISEHLESWWAQNPFLRGMNWTSALEVAFRSLSWIWIDHLVGSSLDAAIHARLMDSLYRHGAYLDCNLSTYFSPNTHLLGEAVALHAIGLRFQVEKWRKEGHRIVTEELNRQVAADGSHFEQSTYYHVYALDFFLLHAILAGSKDEYEPVLTQMAEFLTAVVGPIRLLTCFGDDDGGRLFHPFGPRERFPRATLATCAAMFSGCQFEFHESDLDEQASWWLQPPYPVSSPPASVNKHFPVSGLTSVSQGSLHLIFDAGPFGVWGAGHSHADTLSFTMRNGDRELLIDPGTYTYVADPELRDLFRSTAAHNTIRIGSRDQADPAGPFRWTSKPAVKLSSWHAASSLAFIDASCTYRQFVHRRRLLVWNAAWVIVVDEVTGPPGVHAIEQFWHLGDPDVQILFCDPERASLGSALRSPVLGSKEPASSWRVSWNTELPHICAAAFPSAPLLDRPQIQRREREISIPGHLRVEFLENGPPLIHTA